MKRNLTLLLVAVLLIGTLVGCNTAPTPGEPSADSTTASTTEATTAESTAPTAEASTTATTESTAATTTVATATPTTTAKKKLTAEEVYASLSAADRDCTTFELDKYMLNLWDSNVTYNESVFPVANADGSIPAVDLMYPIDKVLAVHSADCTRTYEEGKDYTVKNGQLVILPGGNIPIVPYDQLYLPFDNGVPSTVEGRWQQYQEGAWFHQKQIAVSYIHTAEWTLTAPLSRPSNLPLTCEKLKKGEPLRILITGDSIACGGNNSLAVGLDPKCPNWGQLIELYLESVYDSEIELINIAEGGTLSQHGVWAIPETIEAKPDLVIIGFGMNDSTHGVSADTYYKNVTKIIDRVRADNYYSEFVIVSSMVSNSEEAFDRDAKLHEYRDLLYTLEEGGTVVADVTGIHEALLTRKRYYDFTGNNINHPNDFLGRVYAQAIAFLMTDDGR